MSALHLFKEAESKEASGNIDAAIELYRQAYKLNPNVDADIRASIPPVKRLDEDVIKSIDVGSLINSFRDMDVGKRHSGEDDRVGRTDEHRGNGKTKEEHRDSHTTNTESTDTANTDTTSSDTTTTLSKETHKSVDLDGLQESVQTISLIPSPLLSLPSDIWTDIMVILIHTHPKSWFALSMMCRKFAYLGLGTSETWRALCTLVYPQQRYAENAAYESESSDLPIPMDQLVILPQYKNSWQYMLSQRPFVKFLGCYISTVRYYSEGAKAEFSSSWTNPVRTVTYYRYLRFYPDGAVVKVLSDLEPTNVVPYLSRNKRHLKEDVSSEKYCIYHGKWTIAADGEVHIVIDTGSVPYYTFHYRFKVKTVGKFRHARLAWISYYGVRKRMSENDDREGEITEFGLGNEKSFKFVRKYYEGE